MEEQQEGAVYSDKQIQILAVAEKLIARQGFDGTSVRDIALEAGVNVAMISYYFGSKEKLLEALFLYRISAGRLVMEHILNNAALSPIDKIEQLIESLVERMMENASFHRVMLRAQLTEDKGSVNSLMTETKLKNLEVVKKIILEGQRKKVFIKNIDIGLLLMTVIGTIYQVSTASPYLQAAIGTADLSEEEHKESVKKRLKIHLKHVLKAALTHDTK
jgi:AcrR family transcriptional regulator